MLRITFDENPQPTTPVAKPRTWSVSTDAQIEHFLSDENAAFANLASAGFTSAACENPFAWKPASA